MNEKKILRLEYKEVLRNLPTKRRFFAKTNLLTVLKPLLEPYGKVLSFASFKDEVDLSELNSYLIEEKKLFLPKIITNEIHAEADYDCILVPGLAFDVSGIRLGRGGGHYDKLLAKYNRAYTIGILFQEQLSLVPLPKESHDIPVQKLCPL